MFKGLNNLELNQLKGITSFLKDTILVIASSIIIILLLQKFVFMIAYIPSSSMEPTLNIEDRLICININLMHKIERGNIVVFESVEKEDYKMIKRVIGLPGDKVIFKSGELYVNGELINESYIKESFNYSGSFSVPKDKYLVLGDNRNNSQDSRFWTHPYVDIKQIKYIAKFKLFPFKDIGWVR